MAEGISGTHAVPESLAMRCTEEDSRVAPAAPGRPRVSLLAEGRERTLWSQRSTRVVSNAYRSGR
jgi:hypothetical protein